MTISDKSLTVYSLLILIKIINCLPDVRGTCKSVPNLTRQQLELCYKANDVTLAAVEGLELAVKECEYQFRWNRWNCSSLSNKRKNPHSSKLFKRGYRESAFGHAITAAGVVLSVARACSQGRLLSCGCDPNAHRKGLSKSLRESLEKEKRRFLDSIVDNPFPFVVDKGLERSFGLDTNEVVSKKKLKQQLANRWKWSGCSHNIDFGNEYSEVFLDARERAGDIQSQINLHNNNVGRVIVTKNLVGKCKCHGLSGSCQLKTCWKSSPDFQTVGKILKQQFRRAVLVDQSNFGNGMIIMNNGGGRKRNSKSVNYRATYLRDGDDGGGKKKIKRSKMESSLFYFQRSPNFCEKDTTSDIPGTHGRRCNHTTSTGSDSCSSLCCGRGFRLIKEVTNQRCNCRFHWCCHVECLECEKVEWISICN